MSMGSKKFSIRKTDLVEVIAGKEKGKIGRVLKLDVKSQRVSVENLNKVTRHVKKTQTSPGSKIEKELPIHYSNILLLCPKCNKGVRHGIKSLSSLGEDQKTVGSPLKSKKVKKVRVCKRCDENIDAA